MTKNVYAQVICSVLFVASLATSAGAQSTVFVYDWSTANASTAGTILDNTLGVTGIENDGWERVADFISATPQRGQDDIVRSVGQPDAFFSGNFFTTTLPGPQSLAFFDDRYLRKNDSAFSFSIPANATEVDLSFVLQANANLGTARFGLEGIQVLNFGVFQGEGQWGVRSIDQVTIATNVTGAALLDQTTRTYKANLTLDLTAPGPLKTVDLVVDNLTDGGSEVIFTDLPFNLGANADPSLWDELSLRAGATSIDNLTVAFSVPEPSAGLLMMLCGVLSLTRRSRH